MKQNLNVLSKIQRYAKLSSLRHRQGHLSVFQQTLEMLGLALLNGNGPGYYQMAGFYRRSIPWREKCHHISEREFEKRLRKLNHEYYKKLSQNKLSEKGLLQLLGYPTPRFLGHLHPLFGRSHIGPPLRTERDLAILLEAEELNRICFKLVEGWGGKSFEAVDVLRKNGSYRFHRLKNGEVVGLTEFYHEMIKLDPLHGVLIEDYFSQHPVFTAFNPDSVNTCRIWVLEAEKKKPQSLLAYLRIGRAGSLVDNQSRGGIVAPIDLDTGITRSAIDGLPERREFPIHPDHGAPITGQKLPYWDKIQVLAESCLASFPGLGFAGLDIGVSAKGPAVLEMNVKPDREGAAFVDIPPGRILPS